MIIAVDCETRGLNTKEFVMGTIVHENLTSEVFYKKKEMWERILEIGEKQHKNKKVLYVYAHNHNYDFLTYANYLDPQIIIYNSSKPFILAYTHKKTKKEYIKFLDNMSLFPMSLAKLGNMLGHEKGETPQELINAQKNIPVQRLKEIEKYMIQDATIIIHAIKYLKKKCREEGITVRRFYTINQIAINHMIQKFREIKGDETIFKDVKYGEIQWTKNKEEIHEAYRGSRVTNFKTGTHENVNYIDINNLYGHSATKMKFPKLNTEIKLNNPLKNLKFKELMNYVGISKIVIKTNKTDKIGYQENVLNKRKSLRRLFIKNNKQKKGSFKEEKE